MNRKLFGMVIGIFLALGLVNASEYDILTFNQTEDVNIFISCSDSNGLPCNASISCNMTLFFPNNTVWNNTQLAYFSPGFFNRSLGSVSSIGDYKYGVNCTDGIYYDSGGEYFRIVKNLTSEYLENITGILYGMSMNVSMINQNMTAYFADWNATFFFWNNSYFVDWNNTVHDVAENFSYLLEAFGCSGPLDNQICSLLTLVATKQDLSSTEKDIKASIKLNTAPINNNIAFWRAFWSSWVGWVIIISIVVAMIILVIWGLRKAFRKKEYEGEMYGTIPGSA